MLLIGGKTEPVSDRVSGCPLFGLLMVITALADLSIQCYIQHPHKFTLAQSGHSTWKQNVGHLLKQRETFR